MIADHLSERRFCYHAAPPFDWHTPHSTITALQGPIYSLTIAELYVLHARLRVVFYANRRAANERTKHFFED